MNTTDRVMGKMMSKVKNAPRQHVVNGTLARNLVGAEVSL